LTNVVVIGEHLSRKNPLTARLSALPGRDIYKLFISADKPRKNTDQLLHFDQLPTILEFSGFAVDQGLGPDEPLALLPRPVVPFRSLSAIKPNRKERRDNLKYYFMIASA
jgi:hypothetical protein